jgi:hypothetical protein
MESDAGKIKFVKYFKPLRIYDIISFASFSGIYLFYFR